MNIDTNTQTSLARERMAATPYAPSPGISNEQQQTNAVQYIAFYLGEIEKQLERIANSLQTGAPNEQIRLQLMNIEKAIADSVHA